MHSPTDQDVRNAVSAAVQSVLHDSELATLAIGEHLYAIVAKAQEFISQLQGTVGVIGSTGEGSVSNALDQQSAATDDFVRDLGKVTSENESIANRVIENTDGVAKAAKSVSDVAAQARMLCVDTKIEAGRLGDLGRPFMVIADQMRELSDAIAGSSDRITELTSDLAPLLDEIKASVRGLHGRTTDFTERHKQHREMIGTISKKLQDVTAETLNCGDENLAEIIGRSGRSLESLQTQDIISQKLRKVLAVIHADEVPCPIPAKFQHVGFVSDELPPNEESLNSGDMEMF